MSVTKEALARIAGIVESDRVVVLPIGTTQAGDRGLVQAAHRWPTLGNAVKMALGVAALAIGLHGAPAEAAGVGSDVNVYGQSAGQVMQHGQGIPAKVIGVRSVMIELAQDTRRQNALVTYGVPTALAGIGGTIGYKLGGNSSTGQQIGAVLGGIAGGMAGAAVTDAMSGQNGPQQVPGVEITVRNPVTNNIAVITQAGEMQIAEGDNVLVVSMGNTVRVVPDRSRSAQQQTQAQAQGFASEGQTTRHDTAMEVIKTASTLGLRIDPTKVAVLIEPGPVPNQVFGGKVVGVDNERGLVYQELGRGAGTVHSTAKLSRVPAIGEYVNVQYAGGFGNVTGKGKQLARNGVER